MNKARLTALCHRISKESGLTFNSVMLYYFLESILKKLVQGNYAENLIFKGGFLLSHIVGIASRSTMDIDIHVEDVHISEENVLKLFSESLNEQEGDEIQYEIMDICPIKGQDVYGGYRVRILCRCENIRQVVPLDVATGDVITPQPIYYSCPSVFEDAEILIKAYPLETMLAEKIHTIYARGFLNSRNKDYYDLSILYRLKNNEIDIPTLGRACERTFNVRNTVLDLGNIQRLLERLKKDDSFLTRWNAYTKKNSYAKNIRFETVIDDAIKLISEIQYSRSGSPS